MGQKAPPSVAEKSYNAVGNWTKHMADVSIYEKIENLDDVSGFLQQGFDSLLRDLAIFLLKCNKQHSSIPKKLIKNTSNV